MSETPARRQRRYDPGRRERIIDAAVKILVRDGLDMLTHRAVAAEADVQIGSMTYHFTSKEELVAAVLEKSVRNGVAELAVQLEGLGAATDLAVALTEAMRDLVVNRSDQLLVDYEIFVAVRRRPQLRDLAARWPTIEYDAILTYTDPLTARILTDLFEGMLVQFVIYGRDFYVDEVRYAFQRAVGSGSENST